MSKKYKWLLGLFLVSLTLNLFLIGMELGQEYRKKHHKHISQPMTFNVKKFSRYLSKDERLAIRELIKPQRASLKEDYRQMRDAEKRVVDLIVEPEIDAVALKEALKEHGDRVVAFHAPMQDVILQIIMKMDYKSRQKLAEDMFKKRRFDPDCPAEDSDKKPRLEGC